MTSAVHPSLSSLTLVKALPPPPTGPMTAIPAPINIVPTNGIQAQIASGLCEVRRLSRCLIFSKLTFFQHCKVQPKYFDGTKFHPFCGKTCALSARILASSSATTNSPQAGNHVPQTHQAQKSLCVVSRFRFSRYCRPSHTIYRFAKYNHNSTMVQTASRIAAGLVQLRQQSSGGEQAQATSRSPQRQPVRFTDSLPYNPG